MDIKQLLEKIEEFAGEKVGQKPGDQWRGTDATPPGKKLVGDSILKDLSKGKLPKSKEQELSEEFQAFLEAEFQDTVDKRPGRKNARPARGHEPKSGYKTVKANEGWATGSDRVSLDDSTSAYWQGQGPLQKEYEALYDQLVPASGAADTMEGEVLRAASKIVYRHFNDGDEFNKASFDQLKPMIGTVTSYDDLAHKATEFALKANGNYHPNAGWDCMDVMDYGPTDDEEDDDYDDEEDDWYDDEDDLEEAKHFRTTYGWAGGRNEKTGGTYKHPDRIKADREAKKAAKAQQSSDAMKGMFGGDSADLTKNLTVRKGVDEAAGQVYTVNIVRRSSFGGDRRVRPTSGTLPELIEYFGYTLETGKSYERERGRYKINMNPKSIESLVDNLNKAKSNAAANGHSSTYYEVAEEQVAEARTTWNNDFYVYDPKTKTVKKKFRTHKGAKQYAEANGLKVASAEYYHDSISKEVKEGWESGPEEYKEPYDDADDAYDRQRQEKIDTEAEKEWAKLPKVSTYKLVGRGPNMEPNYEFGDEFDTLEQAVEYRAEIMKDPKTPYPEHIGIRTLTRVKDQTNENSVTTPKNTEHAKQMMKDLGQLQTQVPNPDPELAATIARRKDILMKQAKDLGIDESRAHKVLDTWFKNRERQEKFARGELTVPTPQERNAKIEKPKAKKQVKELMATPPQGTTNQSMQQKTQAQDPKQAQAVAQATQAMKSATGSSAPATTLAKALDTASQGKPIAGQEASALQPLMKDMATVAQDPKLAGSFKSLVNQINQAQLKQK